MALPAFMTYEIEVVSGDLKVSQPVKVEYKAGTYLRDAIENTMKNAGKWAYWPYVRINGENGLVFRNPGNINNTSKKLLPVDIEDTNNYSDGEKWLNDNKSPEERKEAEKKTDAEIEKKPEKSATERQDDYVGMGLAGYKRDSSIYAEEAWETRWSMAMERRKQLDEHDRKKDERRYPGEKQLDDEYEKVMGEWQKNDGNIIAVAGKIYRTLAFGLHWIGTRLSYIPEDLHDYGIRTVNNLEIVGLILERIATSVKIISDIWLNLDMGGATNMLSTMAKRWKDAMDEGIKYDIIDAETGGLKPGFEQFMVPSASGPNSEEDLRKWVAVKNLINMPIIGNMYKSTLEMNDLIDYQKSTGIGIPDERAWRAWVLNSGQAGAIPVTSAADEAGTIPEWFLAASAVKLQKEIKAHQAEELAEKRKREEGRKQAHAKVEKARTKMKNRTFTESQKQRIKYENYRGRRPW